ncbi:IclR family transcriptional regulator [Bordetella sp. 2513F-2]
MSRPPSSETTEGVAAVERALAIVEAVAQHGEPIGLADLARATGFYKSTLLRLIASLERAALVMRQVDGRYSLGPYAYRLGRAYEKAYGLTDVILPLLQEVVEAGSESASFHVYHDATSRVCLLRVDSHHSTLDRIRPGDLLPLARGAAGKLLSRAIRGEEAEAIPEVETSMGERDPDCAAVASPVYGPDNVMCGVISLSGPKERYTPAAIKKMSKLARDAARQATRALGGRWPSGR